MDINSRNLRLAIEQLLPKWQQILGPSYPAFEAELDAILLGGTDNQLLDLLGHYPDVHEQLLDYLGQQPEEEVTKGMGTRLFGDPHVPQPNFCYRCPSGSPQGHTVDPETVVKRNAGRALCPEHQTVMTVERPSQQVLPMFLLFVLL